ncbi:MAG TPA: O-antigen ligase family protein [Solirubrobacterales bacterium]|nr:O-antigen ligase family protein [Solirubrobacterales bacterium]
MTVYAGPIFSRLLPLAIAGSAVLVGALAGYEPRMALGLAVGLVFVAITLTSLTAGVCVFAILTFIDEVVPSGGLPLTRLLGMLLILSWLAAITVGEGRGRKLFESNGVLFLILLFVLWVTLSALWAADSGEAIGAATRYAPNALLFLVVYAAVRNRSQAMWVIGALLIGALIAAAYGVVVPVEGDSSGRLSGAFGNANETATALAVGVALAAGLAVALRGHPALQLAATIGVPLCMLALFLTVSRGGIVALVAILVAGVFIAGPRRGTVLGAAALGALMAIVYFGAFAGEQEREHLFQSDGGTGRTDIWKVGWRMVEANPVVGVGAGNFQSSSVHYLLEPGAIERADFIVDDPKVAHNTYLGVLAELGVVGLALFLAIVGAAIASLWRAAQTFGASGDREMDLLSRAVLIALIGFLTAAFFGSREVSNQLWLLLALGPAMLGLARAQLGRFDEEASLRRQAER